MTEKTKVNYDMDVECLNCKDRKRMERYLENNDYDEISSFNCEYCIYSPSTSSMKSILHPRIILDQIKAIGTLLQDEIMSQPTRINFGTQLIEYIELLGEIEALPSMGEFILHQRKLAKEMKKDA